MRSPTPRQVKRTRLKAKLTQAEAGEAIGKTGRMWANYENGSFIMDPIHWWYFKTEQTGE